MDFRDLAYFETIAEHAHLGRAADILGRTKPALTKCVRRLEEQTGLILFERRGRHIVLTPGGELLRRKARDLRVAMDEAESEVAGFVRGSTGHLRIGAGPTVGHSLLPGILSRLHAHFPSVTAEVTIGTGNRNRDLLTENKLDVVMTTIFPEDNANFDVCYLTDDEVIAVASSNNKLFRMEMIRAIDIAKLPWVLPDASAESRRWLDMFFYKNNCPRPNVFLETSSINLSKEMVSRSDVIGFIPASNIRDDRDIRRVDVCGISMRRRIGIISRKSAGCIPVILQLINTARIYQIESRNLSSI